VQHSHFQQDSHEFLLNLVTEFEKELVETVQGVTKKIEEESQSSPQMQKSSLLNFFSNRPKTAGNRQEKDTSSDSEQELICRLPPAKCFRAELSRTLTCKNCGYSRKQAETFYDFSLDLPYYPVPEQEPTAEQEPQASPSPERQCFCSLSPVAAGEGGERYYCCPKSSCSYREKCEETEQSPISPTKQADTVMKAAVSPATPATGFTPRPLPIQLETLIQKQFETEVLELTCEKCKVGKEAESAYLVKSLPSVLVFHLKRFEVNPHNGALFKRCDPVIPPAVIDPVHTINNTTPSGNEARYVLKVRAALDCFNFRPDVVSLQLLLLLQSVIHHLGKNIDEGHYVADVCNEEGQWIRRNDTHESLVRGHLNQFVLP
jgi:ubiquitin C-terminal hydrolase